jgi:hypothetical protein
VSKLLLVLALCVGGVASAGRGRAVPTGHANTEPPKVGLSMVSVTGKLPKDTVHKYLHRNHSKFQYCYEKELLSNPTAQGTVTVKFSIEEHGKVESITADGMGNVNVEDCVHRAIESIEFPKPKSGKVQVTATIKFAPPPPPPEPKRKRR